MIEWINRIFCGDWIEVAKQLPDQCVHCIVTSPPYWGQRNYGVEGQLGLEKTFEEHIDKLVVGFRQMRRILRDDGVMFLNYGDKYATMKGKCYNPGGGTESYHNNQKQAKAFPLNRGRATCGCEAGDPVPCVVFDPFIGAGTVAAVAAKLGRNYSGSELSEKYLEQQAQPRIRAAETGLTPGEHDFQKALFS